MIKFLMLLLVLCGGVYGQDTTLTRKERFKIKRDQRALLNDKYKIASLYFTQTGFQDQRMSPLVFSGYGTALDLQTTRYSDKSFRDFQVRGMYNMSAVSVLPNAVSHFSKVDVNYSCHWRIKKTSKEKIYFGGGFNNMMNFRYYPLLANNSLGFDLSTGLSPSVVWIKENVFRKKLVLQAKGGFTAVAFVLRYPQFVYNGTESTVKVVSQFSRVFFEIGLAPKFKYSEENRYYFAYVFDAYAFSSAVDGNKIRTYVNGIKFGFWLKTK
ncbi:MAG: hypothetical protein ACJA0Q_001330 [Saprospiraceae bacterium]|jgi:hypothetical protein